jgi:type IV pilus assembly protein PilB
MMSRSLDKDLGELLVEGGFITPRQLERARDKMTGSKEPLQKILIKFGFVSEKDVTQVIGQQMGVEFVDLEEIELKPELARAIPEHLAQRYKVIPVGQRDNRLKLAMVDPLNVLAIDDIRLITGFDIDPVIATEELIMKRLTSSMELLTWRKWKKP